MRSIRNAVAADSSPAEAIRPGFERLTGFLSEIGLEAAILTPGVPMPTVPQAAAAIGVGEERIIKSVLFAGSDIVVLAIAAGTARIDRQRLAELVGVPKLRLADAATVLAVTGYPAGGVAPIGHATRLPVVIDRRVMDLPVVYGGAGSEDALLEIAPADIQRLTGARIESIVEP